MRHLERYLDGRLESYHDMREQGAIAAAEPYELDFTPEVDRLATELERF